MIVPLMSSTQERGFHHLVDIGCDMALQVRVAPSKVKKDNFSAFSFCYCLALVVILFYAVYYVVLSLGCKALRVDELDVLAPFDFQTNPSWANTNYKEAVPVGGTESFRSVPLRLNELVFAEPVAVKSFLPQLLGPPKDGGPGETPRLLSRALFCLGGPGLMQLLEVQEEHVRTVGQSHLEAYWEHRTPQQLRTVLPPQVFLGLRHSSSSIVAITASQPGLLVSLLGPALAVGGQRTKAFKCTAPSFTKTMGLSPEVLLVSTEVTYFVCGLLFILVVEEWVWDYAISVTVLHVAITSTEWQYCLFSSTRIRETV
ncbi:hypothetical protein QTO34_001129 [Cnephaeus nilssonii]|uniref:Transmembrane protein 244 n=1 Tax=Cnephaeus nilssonii TaxID=3371016 RepID=A0AA40LNC6_CNENI|nr:hypothetical protein QTO34_001129 [Eptesicus nilssonii]